MSNTQSIVKMQINEAALIKNLGSVFTDKTKVLAELLQNGRRAGATSISITFDADTQTLVVTDNGCGITDMQHLLTVADSGWDAKTCTSESPFGMGFLSTLFTAQAVKVESKGKQISFNTVDAINRESIAVESSDFIGGTRVTLAGFDVKKEVISEALVTGTPYALPYAAGFPISITYNDVELARPDAVDDRYIDCEIGKIRLFCSINERYDVNIKTQVYSIAYLQGLPIATSAIPWHTIVHLNGEFMARMPDRDQLLDLDVARKRIHQVVIAEYRKHFEALKAVNPRQLFEPVNYSAIENLGLLDLLNDIDFLPANFYRKYDDYPMRDVYGIESFTGDDITRVQLEAGSVVTLAGKPSAGEWGEKSMALAMLAWKLEWPMLDKALDSEHWAMQLAYPRSDEKAKDSDDIDVNVEIAYTPIKVDGEITLVDCYTLTYLGHSFTFTDDAVSVGDFGNEESNVIVPTGEQSACVLSQFNDWECEDVFDKRWKDDDEAAFLKCLAILRGEEGAATLRKVFEWKDINNSNLVGKSFTVRFVEDESSCFMQRTVVVEEITAKA